MAKIKVNVDTLRDNANQVTRQIQALESLNSRLDQLLNQIEGSWTGNASEQYLATMRQHKQKTQAMVKVLETFRDYMQRAARGSKASITTVRPASATVNGVKK